MKSAELLCEVGGRRRRRRRKVERRLKEEEFGKRRGVLNGQSGRENGKKATRGRPREDIYSRGFYLLSSCRRSSQFKLGQFLPFFFSLLPLKKNPPHSVATAWAVKLIRSAFNFCGFFFLPLLSLFPASPVKPSLYVPAWVSCHTGGGFPPPPPPKAPAANETSGGRRGRRGGRNSLRQ